MNLVTGATGILGSHVVLELLRAGKPVVACKRQGSDLSKIEKLFSNYSPEDSLLFPKIIWRNLDIEDVFEIEDCLEGITNVYHCAGFVSFHTSDRKRLHDINAKGTKNIVNACLNKKIAALCHVSSLATLNNLDYTAALDEKVFWKTSGRESDYALSKYNAEREVWRGVEEGLNAVIVNPGVIIAPGFYDQSSSKLFETGYKGNKFYSEGTTGYVAASDVARIMMQVMEKKLFANRFIIVEDNYTFQYVFSKVNRCFNRPAPSIKVNRFILNLGRIGEAIWRKLTGGEKILSRAVVNSAFNKQRYSNEKVKSTLNFNFMATDKAIEFACKIYLDERKKLEASI